MNKDAARTVRWLVLLILLPTVAWLIYRAVLANQIADDARAPGGSDPAALDRRDWTQDFMDRYPESRGRLEVAGPGNTTIRYKGKCSAADLIIDNDARASLRSRGFRRLECGDLGVDL